MTNKNKKIYPLFSYVIFCLLFWVPAFGQNPNMDFSKIMEYYRLEKDVNLKMRYEFYDEPNDSEAISINDIIVVKKGEEFYMSADDDDVYMNDRLVLIFSHELEYVQVSSANDTNFVNNGNPIPDSIYREISFISYLAKSKPGSRYLEIKYKKNLIGIDKMHYEFDPKNYKTKRVEIFYSPYALLEKPSFPQDLSYKLVINYSDYPEGEKEMKEFREKIRFRGDDVILLGDFAAYNVFNSVTKKQY
jgi:hypothetical protein